MTRLVLAPLVLTGCLIVPTTETTRAVAIVNSAAVPGVAGPVSLAVERTPTQTIVRAYRVRTCTQLVREVVTETAHPSAKMEVPTGSGEAIVLFAYLAPVTLTISGIVTAIVVNRRHDETTEHERVIARRTLPCPQDVASYAVHLELAPGETIDGVTDATGALVVSR